MRRILARIVNLPPVIASLLFACTLQAQDASAGREAQRELYLAAQEAWLAGRTEEYQSFYTQLSDYPLRVYLDYNALSPQLAGLALAGSDSTPVDTFLNEYSNSYLGERLERTWVNLLAREKRWADVLRYYKPGNSTVTLSCYALEARLHMGDLSALREVAPLWNVSRSQPNDCDPLFEAWLGADGLTPEIAWQRFRKTLDSGNNTLARYIAKLMSAEDARYAQRFLDVDRNPRALLQVDNFSDAAPKTKETVLYGLRQLAISEPSLTLSLVHEYVAPLSIPVEEVYAIQRYAIQRLQVLGNVEESENLLRQGPHLLSESLVAWIARDALRKQDWSRLEYWLTQLPAAARDEERWQYWRARALQEKGGRAALDEAQSLRRGLAKTRSYFGFLAATQLGVDYDMAAQAVSVEPAQVDALMQIPAIVRANELYELGEEVAARSEWQFASAQFDDAQVMASGKLAERWGWHRNSIQAMIRIQYWDDLDLRFPLAYAGSIHSTAEETQLSPYLIYAIARQESAFMHDVRSSAGALGLMQLMPATGRETAAGMGMRISNQDLLVPETNIAIGSRYLSGLLKSFNGNRILAAAAYNAGPNRVRQWLQRTAETPVPFDVWIETIPYGETRNYVESVLTYAVIYGFRMGEHVALLSEEEMGERF